MTTKADQLKRRAEAAADVRRYDTDPDVIAYRLERRSTLGTGLIWAGIVLGLAFTVPNVQQFVAGDADQWSITWTTAWLLDVMVSLPLIGVLILEQATTKHSIQLGPWARVLKWGSLSATYAMNTWHSWSLLDAPGILVHSVPPLMVFVCAEVLPDGRDRITRAVAKAIRKSAAESTSEDAAAAAAETADEDGQNTTEETPRSVPDQHGHEISEEVPAPTAEPARKPRADKGTTVPRSLKTASETSPRRLSDEQLADQLDTAIADARLSETPSVAAVQKCLGVGFDRAKRVLALRESRTETVALSVVETADEATAEREEVAA